MAELAWLDATAQAELVRKGEVTPSELVEAAIGWVEALNPQRLLLWPLRPQADPRVNHPASRPRRRHERPRR